MNRVFVLINRSIRDNLDEMLVNNRKAIYEAAYAKNPKRWSGTLGIGKEPKKFILTLIKQKKVMPKIEIYRIYGSDFKLTRHQWGV